MRHRILRVRRPQPIAESAPTRHPTRPHLDESPGVRADPLIVQDRPGVRRALASLQSAGPGTGICSAALRKFVFDRERLMSCPSRVMTRKLPGTAYVKGSPWVVKNSAPARRRMRSRRVRSRRSRQCSLACHVAGLRELLTQAGRGRRHDGRPRPPSLRQRHGARFVSGVPRASTTRTHARPDSASHHGFSPMPVNREPSADAAPLRHRSEPWPSSPPSTEIDDVEKAVFSPW